METFVGDTVKIILMTKVDLSSYADLRMRFRRPDRSIGEWIATVSISDPTWMEYTTLYTDLNLSGTWVIEALAADNDTGILLHGRPVEFIVLMPLRMIYTSPFSASAPTFAGSLNPIGS